MFSYDGEDSVFATPSALGRIFELNLDTFTVNASTTIPYGHSTAILGSRMEMVITEDGLKYLYVMRHTGQEMWRTLKFW
jgi:predicted metallo-beta-lactamase superfamily hydrolase